MKRARVDEIIKKYCNNPIVLKDQPPVHNDLPTIVNIVATIKLLPEDKQYKFPLEAIAMTCSGLSQFAPCKFAADILRLEDKCSSATALVFRSGKIVIVSGITIEHVRYSIQVFRSVIEKIKCTMLNEHGEIVVSNLQGRTTFHACKIQNIVGNGDLGQRVDLKALRDAAPDIIKYEPDIFPGAKCTIMLTDSRTCECSQKNNKCRCTCRTLIFDTGKVVVTGGQSIQDVNRVFFKIKQLAPQFIDTDDAVPKEKRFAHRFAKILQDGFGQKLAAPKTKKKRNTQTENAKTQVMTEEEAIALALTTGETTKHLHTHKRLRYQGDQDKQVTPFIKACDLGQLANVQALLQIDPDLALQKDSMGRTALDRLYAMSEEEKDANGAHDKIIDLLNELK